MCIDKIYVKSGIKNYSVFFENSFNFITELSEKENSVFVIDENVWKAHNNKILKDISKDKLIILQIREEDKNIDTVCNLYKKIMQFAPRKNLNLISIGGGITQDITGFVASTLYRGINWIFVPTTLLAQVDSCIGAKTSLNFLHYKNLIGTFYPPLQIHIFPEFLKTLTKADYYSGVGEMAKLHLMDGEESTTQFIESLEKIDCLDNKVLLKRIKKCLEIKKSYIEDDEFDTGKRNMLNYGHCIGHAIESSTNFTISHGQAVVVGMIIANLEAKQRNILSSTKEKYIRENILLPILKVKVPDFDICTTIEAMKQDKKNIGNGLSLVMIKDNHEMLKITDLSFNEAENLLKKYKKLESLHR